MRHRSRHRLIFVRFPVEPNKHTMQAGILLLIAATARAAANTDSNSTLLLSTAPFCALPCFVDGYNYGKCTMTGLADCMCTNIPLQARVSECVQKGCGFPDQVATVHLTQNFCRDYPKQGHRRYHEVLSIGLPSLTAAIVILRCVARIHVAKRLWWDDGTALLALGFIIVMSGLGMVNSNLGYGYHYWDIDPNNGKTILKIFYVQQMLYIFVQAFAKASIACFYLRIFINTRFQLAIKCFLVFLVIQGLLFMMLLVFQCRPIESNWDRYVKGQCFNVMAIVYGGAACSILEDFFLIVLPIPELAKLKLSLKKRRALVFMFALGSFACVASIVRLQYLLSFADSFDSTYDNVMGVIWSALELNFAVICGSLPSLWPLLRKLPVVFTAAQPATTSNRSNRQSRERSVTFRTRSPVSHDNSAQSSPGKPSSKTELSSRFGSPLSVYDKHTHVP
ncbi:integral membrane protein [Colletotrichum caudatum]|nr:integral membrane protein [Colletotrichum caudatum]